MTTNKLLDDFDAIWVGMRIPLAITAVIMLAIIAGNTR